MKSPAIHTSFFISDSEILRFRDFFLCGILTNLKIPKSRNLEICSLFPIIPTHPQNIHLAKKPAHISFFCYIFVDYEEINSQFMHSCHFIL